MQLTPLFTTSAVANPKGSSLIWLGTILSAAFSIQLKTFFKKSKIYQTVARMPDIFIVEGEDVGSSMTQSIGW